MFASNNFKNNFREMVSKSKKEVGEGDHKYRPLTLVLAVLYRCDIQEERKNYMPLSLL